MAVFPLTVLLALAGCGGDDTTGDDTAISDADTDTDSDADTDTDTDADADADADSDADADADSDADADADTDTDADTCSASFEIEVGGGTTVTLDGCGDVSVSATHVWSDVAGPEVSAHDITWSTGEADCWIRWSQTAMCGAGYYAIEEPVGELTVDLTGCADLPKESRDSHETAEAWALVTEITAGTDSGVQEGQELASTFVGSLEARVGTGFNGMELVGTFSYGQRVTGVSLDGALECEVSTGDEDGDGYIDEIYGGTDCDDSDAGINPYAEDIAGDGIDQDCDGSDTPWLGFDDFAVGFSYYFTYQGSGPESIVYDGVEQVPYVEIVFFETDYFSAYDDRYTCTWWGEMVSASDHDLNYTDADLWLGWSFSLQLIDTDCEDFNTAFWGDSSPTTLIESMTHAYGAGELTSTMASDLEAWVGSDWETDYEPYLFAYILGYYDETVSDLVGHETGYTWAFELDSDGEILVDSDDSLTPIEYDGRAMPEGYIVSGPYWLWYVEGLFY